MDPYFLSFLRFEKLCESVLLQQDILREKYVEEIKKEDINKNWHIILVYVWKEY